MKVYKETDKETEEIMVIVEIEGVPHRLRWGEARLLQLALKDVLGKEWDFKSYESKRINRLYE